MDSHEVRCGAFCLNVCWLFQANIWGAPHSSLDGGKRANRVHNTFFERLVFQTEDLNTPPHIHLICFGSFYRVSDQVDKNGTAIN